MALTSLPDATLSTLAADGSPPSEWPNIPQATAPPNDLDLGRSAAESLARQQQKTAKALDSALLDFDSFAPEANPAARRRAIASAFVAYKLGVPAASGLAYDRQRATIARELFDGRGADSDDSFFAEIQADAQTRKHAGDLRTNLLTESLVSELASAASFTTETQKRTSPTGKGRRHWTEEIKNPANRDVRPFDLWHQQAKELPGYDPNRAADYLSDWNLARQTIADRIAPFREELFEVFNSFRDSGFDNFAAKNAYYSLPEGQHTEFLEALGLLARTLPAEERVEFWANLKKQAGRDTSSTLGSIGEGLDRFTSDLGVGFAPTGPDGQTTSLTGQARMERTERNFRADIERIAHEDYDPIKTLAAEGSWLQAVELGAYAAPGAITYTATAAVPFIGQTAVYASLTDQAYVDMRRNLMDQGLTDADASRYAGEMAGLIALPQAALEKVGASAVLGKLPFLNRALTRLGNRLNNRVAAFGTRAAGVAAFETGIELTQDLVPDAAQEIASALDQDLPGTDWQKTFENYGHHTLTTFVAVLPLAIIGAAINISAEERRRTITKASDLELEAAGIDPADVAAIRTAEQEGPASTLAAVDRALAGIDPTSDNALEATQELAETLDRQKQAADRAQTAGVLPRFRATAEGFIVTDSANESELGRAETANEALRLAAEHSTAIDLDDAEQVAYLASLLEAGQAAAQDGTTVDADTQTETTTDLRPFEEQTVAQAMAESQQQEARVLEQMQAREALGTPDNSAPMAQIVLGQYQPDFSKGVRADVLRINGGASVLTVFHEKGHQSWRRARETGAITRDEVISFLQTLDTVLAGKTTRDGQPLRFLPEDTSQITDTLLDEAMAELYEAEVLRTRKTDGARNVPPGVITQNLKALGRLNARVTGKIADFIRALRAYFGQVFGRAAAIQRGIREGQIDQNTYEEFLDRLLGIEEALDYDQMAREAEAAAYGEDWTPTDTTPANVDAPFSLGQGFDPFSQLPDSQTSTPSFSVGWNPFEYPRVLPRDLFNEAKVYSMATKFLEDYNAGKLPAGFEITLADEQTAGLSDGGFLFLKGFTVTYNGMPVSLEVAYNAGKTDRFPLAVTAEEIDVWSATVFDEEGNLDSEFLEAFDAQPEPPSTPTPIPEAWTTRRDFLNRLGVVGLWDVDAHLADEFKFDLQENDYETLAFTMNRHEAELENLAATFKGEPVRFYLDRASNQLRFSYGPTDGMVLDGFRGMNQEFREAFGFNAPGFSLGRSAVTPAQDAAYLAAVKAGDMATAQAMIDQAAKAAGYHTRARHGTADKFDKFSHAEGGKMTDAESARKAFFFTDDDPTAKSYAIYAAEAGPVKAALRRAEAAERRGDWDGYEAAIIEAENLDTAQASYKRRENAIILDAYLSGDFLEFDAKGKTPQELHTEDIDAGITARINQAKAQGKDGVVYRNLDDAIDLSNRPATHYAVFKPSQIKSADPVTYDQDGNPVPLSQRFNPTDDRLAFSLGRSATDTKRMAAIGRQFANRTMVEEFDGPNGLTGKIFIPDNNPFADDGAIGMFDGDTVVGFVKIYWQDSNGDLVETRDEATSFEPIVEVHPDYQRQGIASVLYNKAEQFSGLPAKPAQGHTDAAEALWNARRRRGETSFSLGFSGIAADLSADALSRIKDPIRRAQIMQRIARNLETIQRSAERLELTIGEKRLKTSLQREARVRAALRQEELENEAYARHLSILADEDLATLSAQPIHSELLEADTDKNGRRRWKGRLRSKSSAAKAYPETFNPSNYDGAEGISPMLWGGTLDPDQAAQELYEAGLINEPSPDALWDALSREAQTVSAMKDALENAKRDLREAKAKATEEAQLFLDEQLGKQEVNYSPREEILRALATLDGILRGLPPEIRGKVGGYAQLARLGTNETRLAFLKQRLDIADAELEKWLREQYDKEVRELLERAKPDKTEAGKRIKGKLTADVHSLFDLIREAMTLTGPEAELEARTLDAMVEMDAEGNFPDVSEEIEAFAPIAAGLYRLFGGWAKADAATREEAFDAAQKLYEDGISQARGEMMAKREKRDRQRQGLKSATGELDNDAQKRRDKAVADTASKIGRVKQTVLSVLSWEQLLHHAFGEDSPEAKLLADWERRADFAKTQSLDHKFDQLESLFADLAGGKFKGEQLRADLAEPGTVTWKDWKGRKQSISQLEAITATLLWRQEDGKRHMRGHLNLADQPVGEWHYRQEDIDAIEAQLTPEAKAVRLHLAEQYAAEYDRLNPVFRSLFGINMPRHKNYSPITVTSQQAAGGQTMDPLTGIGMSSVSITPGSLKNRSQTAVAEPKLTDALQVYAAHIRQMEHWMAYAEFTTEARAMLNSRTVGNAVEQKAGRETLNLLRSWVDYFTQGGTRDAAAHIAFNQGLGRVINRASSMALVGRVSVLAIQATQLGAAAYEMPTGSFVSRFAKLMTGQLGWKDAIESDYIKRRLSQMPAIVQQGLEGLKGGKPTRLRYAMRQLGELIGGADALFTAGTYAILLDYHRTQGRETYNLKGQQLEAYAHNAAARSTDRVAQPTRAGARSFYEITATNPATKMVWAFASEPRQKLAITLAAAAQGKKRRAFRSLLVTWLFSGAVASVIRSAMRDVRNGDDDEIFDEKYWDPKRMALMSLTGPVAGIPIVGNTIESIIWEAGGEYLPDGNLLDSSVRAVTAIKKLPDYLQGDKDIEDAIKDIEAVLAGAGLGSNQAAAATSAMHIIRDLWGFVTNWAD